MTPLFRIFLAVLLVCLVGICFAEPPKCEPEVLYIIENGRIMAVATTADCTVLKSRVWSLPAVIKLLEEIHGKVEADLWVNLISLSESAKTATS